jgi:3-deoxy-7-phosphoheptulonate synthase
MLPGVLYVHRISAPYKLAGRAFRPEGTVVEFPNGAKIGGKQVASSPGRAQLRTASRSSPLPRASRPRAAVSARRRLQAAQLALRVSRAWVIPGLELMREAAEATGCSRSRGHGDCADRAHAALHRLLPGGRAQHAELQSAARALGQIRKPVLLKRGISATIEELLLSAEYIMSGGNYDVILCERGIRTYETSTRNTMDISAIPMVHKLSHLPIVADPSHGTGRREMVAPMSKAAVAAGADAIMVEIHPNADKAVSDASQTSTSTSSRSSSASCASSPRPWAGRCRMAESGVSRASRVLAGLAELAKANPASSANNANSTIMRAENP